MKIFYQNWCKRSAYIILLFTTLTQMSFVAEAKTATANLSLKVMPPATIKGTVTDDKGGSLPGVSVTVKGSTMGVTTDAQGNFSINVLDNNATLIFSYVGYISQEIQLKGQTTLNIKMSDDTKSLNEVVVIGYGTAKKGDLTGSVSSVSAAEIDKVPVTSIDQSLQGRAAGVQVTTDNGSPGGGISVQIRGQGSFANNSPLYIVDGYPISGGLQSINPNDVQSIDILKDASSAAIYGSRASNGVVIITTKRGKASGGVQISLDAQNSVQLKPEQYKMMTAQQFVEEANTVYQTDPIISLGVQKVPTLPEWQSNPLSYFADKNIDWQNVMEQNGYRQNYNLALRGGGQQVQSSLSLGYFDQTGIEKFSSFQRFSVSENLDYTPYKWLKSATSIRFTHSIRDNRGSSLGQFLALQPTMVGGRPGVFQPKDANGVYGYYAKTQQATSSGQSNVYADLEQRITDNPNEQLNANTSLEATLLPGLKFKTLAGVAISNGSFITFNPANDRDINNNAPIANYNQGNSSTNEWLWSNTLSYNKVFGKHTIDAVAGIEAQQNKYRTTSVAGNGSISNDILNSSTSNEAVTGTTGYTEYWALYSQFGRISYKFDDKYIVTGSIRRDGSSKFGPGKQWGVFPTAGVSWKMKQESFLKNVDAIDDFTLRASWGKAGNNQNIPLFAYQGTYSLGNSLNQNSGYVFGNVKSYAAGFALTGLPNPNLKWETNTQSDIALDMSFLNNKLTATLEYYKRVSTDFLLNVDVPAQTGFTKAQRNIGEMQNNGFEFNVRYRNYDHAFKWAVGVNGSTIKNKINYFADGLTSMYGNNLGLRDYGAGVWTQSAISTAGGTINAFYGYKSAGIFQDQASIDALNAASVAKFGAGNYYQSQPGQTVPGDRKFQDLNGDGRVTPLDRTVLGSPLPKLFGGLTLDASYKQFDFTAFIYTSIGNKIYNYEARNLQNFDAADGVGFQNFGQDFYYNHWTPQNHSTTYSRLVFHDVNGNNRPSDVWIEDGTFARLKTIQVGYTLPANVAKSLHMSKLRVFVSGQNLFTITKYSGLDPEIGNVGSSSSPYVGFDNGNYPTSKYFTLGVNVGF